MPIGTKQIAEMLGIHQFSVSRAIKKGLLKATKIGHSYIVWPADLEAYAANHPRPSRVQPIRVS